MTSWRRSAALRLSISYSVCLVIGTIGLGAAMFWTMHRTFQQQLDADIMDETARLSHEYRDGDLAELREAIAARTTLNQRDGLLYGLFDRQHRRLVGNFPGQAGKPGLQNITFIDPVEGPDKARASTSALAGGLRLVVAADSERMEKIDRTMIASFAIALAGILVLGAIGAVLFAKLLSDRLGTFAERAEAISEGCVAKRMPVSDRGDEFDALATSLNLMLARIEALVENLRQVSGAIAHDLRTPLARLRQKLEAGANGERSGDAGVFAEAMVELDEALNLFRDILHVSEVESGVALPMSEVDLSGLVLDLAESYEPSVREGGRSLTWAIAEAVRVSGSSGLLAQALSNLVENAIHHTPPGSRITVRLAMDGGGIDLRVIDDGPGIAADDRARAMRRFERLDPSRSGAGYGLGLTLVDAVARRHGGSLELEDASPGLAARIHLPLPHPRTER